MAAVTDGEYTEMSTYDLIKRPSVDAKNSAVRIVDLWKKATSNVALSSAVGP
jgi:hypothetical protein